MKDEGGRVFIALGSNIEPRVAYLQSAVRLLRTIGEVVRISPVYETEPIGEISQAKFLNAVVEITTLLGPLECLQSLKSFEKEIGRKTRPRWHEREIDFDIIFYGDLIVHSPELTIPHPEIERRAFVLVPMADLDSKFVHPVSLMTIEDLLSRVDATGVHQTSIALA